MRPLGDRIIVKPIKGEQILENGIILPSNVTEKYLKGTVISVGPGRMLETGERAPVGVVEGDKVLFTNLAYAPITVDGESYFILTENEVFAVEV